MNDKNDINDFKPSEQQQEIIDASKTGESFVVNALAGTGKTTTLKQMGSVGKRFFWASLG